MLVREPSRMTECQIAKLNGILTENQSLRVVYEHKERLKALWTQRYQDNEVMLKALIQWCHEAEQSGIRVLEEFAQSLRGYTLAPIYNYR
jgi:stearoyl-CoA desaturase (delta-9 desaturase)